MLHNARQTGIKPGSVVSTPRNNLSGVGKSNEFIRLIRLGPCDAFLPAQLRLDAVDLELIRLRVQVEDFTWNACARRQASEEQHDRCGIDDGLRQPFRMRAYRGVTNKRCTIRRARKHQHASEYRGTPIGGMEVRGPTSLNQSGH